MNLCRVTIAGHLTRDVEVRYTPNGTAVSKASVAVNRKWKDRQTKEDREEVSFIDVDAFGKPAEAFGSFKKGDNIFFEGRLKTDSWEDKQSKQKRSKLIVVAETFPYILSSGEPLQKRSVPDNDDVPF